MSLIEKSKAETVSIISTASVSGSNKYHSKRLRINIFADQNKKNQNIFDVR